ncbi:MULTISPECIES: hypothetical protein [unclassified Bradyrhizobium]|uniref:hypothetical protein n=1 Tax=unclassified Bradyrhizobium TaxID=2631580 RepID=UPI001FF6C5FC|nr:MULTISPECIES: hypothetical protein [unclassified Bradyrhizobium]MCJ9706487.1 hypothetical protein [Bradyrhizobium sp. SHOUNA76]MCJ9733158.1 hypothetical protein [Bradyrhizobium sp. PRIMUS42]
MLFVVLPFVPELAILLTSLFAAISGCQPGTDAGCPIGSSAAEIIRHALEASLLVGSRFGDGLAALWLAACCWLITLGWSRLWIRLLLALAVSLICAFVPYFGPMLSISYLVNPKCSPNEGGVGDCIVYGGDVGSVAHKVVSLGWRIIEGAPIAIGIFVVYAIVAALIERRSRRQGLRPLG